jgi:FkbM family methyltransferase
VGLKSIEWAGRALRKAGSEILRRNGLEGTWIDVGAHHGEHTIGYARHNPGLRIYAFEPNLRAAAKLMGRAPNYVVLPMAITEKDGVAEFHLNTFDASSSLLHLDREAVRSWIGGEALKEERTVTVPTLRLDTFMNLLEIQKVDFLKVDAQGADLAVVKSASSRLRDIAKIVLEVSVADRPLYVGEPSKDEVVSFLTTAGFQLVGTEKQSHNQEENLTFARG